MSTISSGTTLTTALVQTGDTTGNLVIKTGSSNTTAMTISGSDQSITFSGAVNVASTAFANGSASAPSITFTGDTNTGIFSPAADTIAFAEGGVEVIRITSTGNLLVNRTASSGAAYSAEFATSTASADNRIGMYSSGALVGAIQVNTNEFRLTALGASTTLTFQTNSNIRATIDTSGNLGLGVTPSAWNTSSKALQIGSTAAAYTYGGNFGVTNNLYLSTAGNTTYTTTAAASMLYQDTTGGFRFYQAASGTAGTTATLTQAMTLDSSGNLLVGTTSSSQQSGTFGQTIKGSYPGLTLSGSEASARIYTMYETGGTLRFFDGTSGADRFVIGASGQLGIGGTNYGSSGQVLTSGGSGAAPSWGSVSLPTGTIKQVVSATQGSVTSTSSSSYVDISGMSVTITPSSASNKIWIIVSMGGAASGGITDVPVLRNGSTIGNVPFTFYDNGDGNTIHGASYNYLDSPATTSAVTYKLQWRNQGGTTTYLNANRSGGGNTRTSSITVMEVVG